MIRFTGLSVILLCPFAEAQRLGGGGLQLGGGAARQAVQARPATPPNLPAVQAHFGDGSVVHRDAVPTSPNAARPTIQRPNVSPNTPSPAIQRPNITQPGNRPNLSGENLRNVDRSNLNVNRQNLDQVRQNFGPDNRDQIFNRADHTVINRDGPDWKNWQNFNPQRINNTVINNINIDNRSINVIRDNFNKQYNRNDLFTGDWYAKHTNAWCPGLPNPYPPGPRPPYPYRPYPRPVPPPYWWWRHPSWDHAWAWFAAGFFAGAVTNAVLTPVPYYYGSNIVYVQDVVYVNSVPYVSSSEYYQQAQNIAKAGAEPAAQPQQAAPAANVNVNVNVNTNTDAQPENNPTDDWLPMGTFAVVADGNQTESKRILQIATNKQGQVRGNFINQETDTATELYGSVDPQTQRVAFKAKGNDSVIAECGLWNLTQDTVPMLVHFDQNRTEGRTLIRLTNEEPDA